MTVNVPPRLRLAIYLLNVFGAPLVAYLFAKEWIGELEVTLFAAEVSAAFLVAGLNVPSGSNGVTLTVKPSSPAEAAAMGSQIAQLLDAHERHGGRPRT